MEEIGEEKVNIEQEQEEKNEGEKKRDNEMYITFINNYKIIEYAKTNIYVIENILDFSFCEQMVDIINTVPMEKTVYCNGNNVECYKNELETLLRNNDEFYYTFPTDFTEYEELLQKLNTKKDDVKIINNKNNGITKKKLEHYNSVLNNTISRIEELMEKINPSICFKYNSGYILRKIYGTTRLHADGLCKIHDSNITFIKENKKGDYYMVRNASLVFSLNDDYEGGEFCFPNYDVSIKLKKGSVLFFPPYWTHKHKTNELKNDTMRYTITTWSCEKI